MTDQSTTIDLDALERAARAAICGDPMINARERAAGRIALKESATPEAILSLFSVVHALQERVEGAEKALRPFSKLAEVYTEDAPAGDDADAVVPLIGELRAASAYFAARTKAGEPHEQE